MARVRPVRLARLALGLWLVALTPAAGSRRILPMPRFCPLRAG